MIQNLGDLLTLVLIIGVGIVSFLFAILLYHLVFVVMDLRRVMRRLSDLTEQIEGMLMRPVELIAEVFDWLKERVWDAYVADGWHKGNSESKKKKKKKKRRGGFEETNV